MIDLKFSYTTLDNERVTYKFDTIMDFIVSIEAAEILPGSDVEAIFFENQLTKKHFDTVYKLFYHCCDILHY